MTYAHYFLLTSFLFFVSWDTFAIREKHHFKRLCLLCTAIMKHLQYFGTLLQVSLHFLFLKKAGYRTICQSMFRTVFALSTREFPQAKEWP